MAAEVPFPASLDEVTAPWMGALLARRFAGVEVASITPGRVIRGTATKVEYEIDYRAVGDQPPPTSLWLKCGFDIHASEFISHCGAEARFYRDVAPLLGGVNRPATFGVLTDEATQNGLILLEDLTRRPVTFGNQHQPLEPGPMGRVLDLLADCHAALWRDPRLGGFEGFRPGGVIHSTRVIDVFMGFWDYAAPRPRFAHVPSELLDTDTVARAVHALLAADMGNPICVVHGDPHQANLFFDAHGAPGLVDWATAMPGHWAWDVAYLIGGSQSVGQRRRLEQDQLSGYLARLTGLGVAAPDFASAWRDYVRHLMWLFMTALCPAEMQPEDLCVLNAERACAAITDHDSVAAILN